MGSLPSLVECTDLARLHPELAQAKTALRGALDAYLPTLKATGEEADLRRYAAAQACAQADRSEGVPLFRIARAGRFALRREHGQVVRRLRRLPFCST